MSRRILFTGLLALFVSCAAIGADDPPPPPSTPAVTGDVTPPGEVDPFGNGGIHHLRPMPFKDLDEVLIGMDMCS